MVVTNPPAVKIPRTTVGYSGEFGNITPTTSPSLILNFFLKFAPNIWDCLYSCEYV